MEAVQVYQCVQEASARYSVPPALIYAIIRKEGGYLNPVNKNKNGSYDYGLAQINSEWLPKLSKYGISAKSLISNACVNLGVSAWILRSNYEQYKDWTKAIIAYNIGTSWTPKRLTIGTKYASDVIRYWHDYHKYFAKS